MKANKIVSIKIIHLNCQQQIKNTNLISPQKFYGLCTIIYLCFVFMPSNISAQQNTVKSIQQKTPLQINANWKAGDTLLYHIKDYVVEEIEKGYLDTLALAEKNLQVVVIDSSKYGYLLQWETLNLKTIGDAYGPLIKKDIKMQYRTDAFGLVEELINWETIRKLVYDEIEYIGDNQITESELIYWGNNPVQSAYALSTQEGIGSLFAKDLQLLHFNYGTQYTPGESVEFDKTFPVTFGNGEVPGKGQIICEKNDSTIIVKGNSSTNEVALKSYYLAVLKELNGKVPSKEKRKIKQQPLYIKSDRNYVYDINSLALLEANYTRTQFVEGIATTNIVEINLQTQTTK